MTANWILWVCGLLILTLGLGLSVCALFADRSRGRRRCPRCWYDMRGTPGLRCSECGHQAGNEASLLRTRRNRPAALIGAAIFLAGVLLFLTTFESDDVRPIMPTRTLIFAFEFADHKWSLETLHRRFVESNRDPNAPFPSAELSDRQASHLARVILDRIDSGRSIDGQMAELLRQSLRWCDDDQMRRRAARSAGRLFDHPVTQVRWTAGVLAVDPDAPETTIGPAIEAISDEREDVRYSGYVSLFSHALAGVPVTSHLVGGLHDADQGIRAVVIALIDRLVERSRFRVELALHLKELEDSPHDHVRFHRPRLLLPLLSDEERIGFCMKALEGDDETRRGTIVALYHNDELMRRTMPAMADRLPPDSPERAWLEEWVEGVYSLTLDELLESLRSEER